MDHAAHTNPPEAPVTRPSGLIRLAVVALASLAGLQLAFAFLGGFFVAAGGLSPVLPVTTQVARGGLVLAIFGGVGTGLALLCLLAASGLVADRFWAWALAVALGGLYLLGGCLPVGLALVVVLLQPDTRRWYASMRDPGARSAGASSAPLDRGGLDPSV